MFFGYWYSFRTKSYSLNVHLLFLIIPLTLNSLKPSNFQTKKTWRWGASASLPCSATAPSCTAPRNTAVEQLPLAPHAPLQRPDWFSKHSQ